MHTDFCDAVGVEFPIVAFSHCRDVVAAVSRAGGLGVLGISGSSVDELDRELTWLEDAIGGRPYGVDVLLPAPATAASVRVEDLIPAAHKEFVADLLARYGVPPLPDPGSARTVSAAMAAHGMALVEAALEYRVGLVASALGPPPPEMVALAHRGGVPVAALVGRALGASGVWTGSVWLTTQEAETHPAVIAKFLNATSSDTIRSRATTGKPARQLRSAWTDEWEDPAHPDPLPMPLQSILTAEARARIQRGAGPPDSGANALITYFVGQVVGSLTSVRPARGVLLGMVEEYAEVLERLGTAASESAL